MAASHKERSIAVVLTGTGSDGVMGVQDRQTVEFFGMPEAAIHTGSVDFVLPLDEIGPALLSLVMFGKAGER